MFLKHIILSYLNKWRNYYKLKYNRIVPVGELLSDRWVKSSQAGFGIGTSVYDSSIIFGDVEVDTESWIGPNTILDGSGGKLTIGKRCDISAGVQIYTHDTVLRCLSSGVMNITKEPVHIGNNCYIGPYSVISQGITIGDYCVICTNSFVNKSFLPYTIVAGTPAKKIGEVLHKNDGTIELVYIKQ